MDPAKGMLKQPLKAHLKAIIRATVIILVHWKVDAEITRRNKALLDDPTNTALLFELTPETLN